MDFGYSEEQKALRDSIVRFARAELNRDTVERDREETFSREIWRRCGDIRLHGLSVPLEYGGAGLDALSTALALVKIVHP